MSRNTTNARNSAPAEDRAAGVGLGIAGIVARVGGLIEQERPLPVTT